MWGPKCEKVRKTWILRSQRWSLSMRVCLRKSGEIRKADRGEGQYIILYVNCFGRTLLYMCIEYHI